MTYTTRTIMEDDHGLLYSSYLKSSWPRNSELAYTEHCTVSHARMRRCMAASNVIALCLVDDDAPGWVGGWIVGHGRPTGFALHYVYVKLDYRKLGHGSSLVAAARALVTGTRLCVTHPLTVGVDGGARAREWLQGMLHAERVPLSSVLDEHDEHAGAM